MQRKISMLINREKYVEEATLFRDTDLVKVVTGVRRCGKSSLLALVRKKSKPKRLRTGGVISINLEQRGLGIKTDDDLYEYVKSHLAEKGAPASLSTRFSGSRAGATSSTRPGWSSTLIST